MAIVSTDGNVSFPGSDVYGIPTVRVMHNFEIVGRTLDTPRHVSELAKTVGYKAGDSVIVVERNGHCRTVRVI